MLATCKAIPTANNNHQDDERKGMLQRTGSILNWQNKIRFGKFDSIKQSTNISTLPMIYFVEREF